MSQPRTLTNDEAGLEGPAPGATNEKGQPVNGIGYARQYGTITDCCKAAPSVMEFDADGKLIALNHDVVSAWPTQRWGIPDFLSPSVDKKGPLDAFTVNGADFFYSVPNHNVRAILNEMAHNATPSGQLRSVAPGWTFWAVESMVDELAHAAGKDPAQRIALINPEVLPPLELESRPVDVGELITDQLSHFWWSSLLRNLADRVAPDADAVVLAGSSVDAYNPSDIRRGARAFRDEAVPAAHLPFNGDQPLADRQCLPGILIDDRDRPGRAQAADVLKRRLDGLARLANGITARGAG